MKAKALNDLHFKGHKTVDKDIEFDTKDYSVTETEAKILKDKKLIAEVKADKGVDNVTK